MHPDNAQLSYEYDSAHHLTASINARGNRGDELGRQTPTN
jgi:YD repeat-containing protein